MAQSLKGVLDLRHITGLSGADLEMNASAARGFAAGQPMWMFDSFGLRMFTLVQNRGSAAMIRSQFVSRVGNANGVTIITNSVGTTTQISHLSAALTANSLVGGIAYLNSVAGAAIAAAEGEASVVVKNSSTAVDVDPRYPFSAAPVAGLLAQIIGTYNVELAASGDVGTTVAGVVAGQGGISTANFGFVQNFGPTHRAFKDLVTTNAIMTVMAPVSISSGSGQCYQATTATNLNLIVGRTMAPAASVATECMLALACGQGFQVVGTGQVV